MVIAKKSTTSSESSFEQALSYLVINSSFVPNLGLFHGKMGLVLFFSIYARCVKNDRYSQFTYDLLDEVYEDICNDVLLNFENGLCGIGWTIEYLVQNGYMEGNTDEILEDIDRRVMECDVCRISDLSFRSGLAGIVYYVCARLSTFRKSDTLPFNPIFLKNLKCALLNARFSEDDEAPSCLAETFFNVLRGIKTEKLDLPVLFQFSDSQIPDNLRLVPLGLKDGLAGILLQKVINHVKIEKEELISNTGKKQIVIFNEEFRAANYGIGTYLKNLVDALKNDQYEIMVIHLRSHKVDSLLIERYDYMTQIYITDSKSIGYNCDLEKQNEHYYRNVLLLLSSYLAESKEYIFQLNYVETEKLAKVLKNKFPYSRIIATVHYTNWSFELLGDRDRLLKILDSPKSMEDEQIVKSVNSERMLLNICDRVIGIAKHSYDDLMNIYKIPEHKLVLIPHGLKDAHSFNAKNDRKLLRGKYGFKEKELILIFAGRLNRIKGIEALAESFIELQKIYPHLRLIVAGDGDYNAILPNLTIAWSKVVFTGFINKTILYELFSISDIGVLPSFHEEFGYVALEMMMMGLPLVVGRTSGLLELVVDGVSGITVTLNKGKKEENSIALQTAIKELLDNSLLRRQYAKNARLRFLQSYNFEKFAQLTRACFT